jgi:8-oxo-dGTP pyrophosphatase MutT (NUDIX family)
MRTIQRNIVGAFVFSNDNKVLLGRHDPQNGGTYTGSWVIPGGGIDDGETPLQALHREFMEEASLDLSPYQAVRSDPVEKGETLNETGERVLVQMQFYDFEVHIDKPASEIPVTPNEEFSELRWILVADLPTFEIPEVTQGFFKRRGYWHD